MKVEKEVLQTEEKKGSASTQVTFDQDYHLPDYLPDFYTMIAGKGEVRIDECKVTPGSILIRGALKFQILYRTDQNESGISSLDGELPIQETLVLENADEFDMPQISSHMEDLSVRRMNARKLNIRALISLQASAWERRDLEIPIGTEESEGVMPQMRYDTESFLGLLYRGKERCRIREEIRLPSNRSNVRQLIWQQAQVYDQNVRTTDGTVMIQGNIQMFVVYLPQETSGIQWYEEKIPFQCSFDIPQAQNDAVSYVTVHVQDLVCSVSPDADGEERIFLVEAELLADIWLFREEKKEVLTDLYALDRELVLHRKQASYGVLRMKNEADCRITDTITLGETASDILQICAGFAQAEAEKSGLEADGIVVEGTVRTQLFFLTGKDQPPVDAQESLFPFQCRVEIPGIGKDSRYEINVSTGQCAFLMKSGKEVEVQVTIRVQALVVDRKEGALLDEITEQELDQEELNRRPGMVGLRFQEGDSLWEIARTYHTTIDEICRTNALEGGQPEVGTPLLLIRQIVSD